MIVGTGVDIIEIDRVRRAVDRHRSFVDRFFDPREADYYRHRNMNISSIAGGFAAKEAVAKAMGTGLSFFNWKEIAVLRDLKGKPTVELRGRAKDICCSKWIDEILISISHSRDYAIAQAIAIGGVGHEDCNS